MRLVRGLINLNTLSRREGFPFAQGCVATIGNFDGVHVGHQTILEQVKEKAAALGVPSVVMVFEPQPREFFQGSEAPPRLMSFRQKFEALTALGIDHVLCLHFNSRFRRLTSQEFIDTVLVDGLRVRHLVVGDDFRFGCDRTGDFMLLREVGREQGFTVENTRTVTVAGERVSSTRVRERLNVNRLEEAQALLGRPYRIRGRVVYGRQLGREIGAPTANILLQRMAPLQGVYVVSAKLEEGTIYDGVANIGLRPTVDGKQPALEVHLFDFAGTLYGQHIEVVFRHGLREEIKFDSVDALKHQIARDFDDARGWITENGSCRTAG
ncbi:bifunctional riboflavin kinase/FAD synthetase [Marinobacter salinexigens]|uniref:Riboflavin biosynthesis protein n=1 Tax=Marinobacter salinexigens TaxID=2919747 RepID=A0A5B0VAB0_9GAMM|nr:bifunctional riboflavin kinase/FAD synthetase [Marinobacter salinexigens]KAA1171686.1 bifunctional riboflavin kinase/FAD synthetase [Marinobacter salinexigens]